MKNFLKYTHQANSQHRAGLELFPFSYRPPTLKGVDMLDCLAPEFNRFVKMPENVFLKVNSVKRVLAKSKKHKKHAIFEMPGNINDFIQCAKHGPIASLFSCDLSMASGSERKLCGLFNLQSSLTHFGISGCITITHSCASVLFATL